MRFISSCLIKGLGAGALLAIGSPAAAQYFDIYGEANRTLPSAQSAFDAMDEDANAETRAKRTSDLIMGLIGKAKYKEAYELYLENADLDLHPDARMGAVGRVEMGNGVVAGQHGFVDGRAVVLVAHQLVGGEVVQPHRGQFCIGAPQHGGDGHGQPGGAAG